MPNNVKFAVALKNLQLDQITSQIGTSGLVRIYSGTQPTNPDTALSGNTLLAELPCSATFAPSASGGVLTANAITSDSSADATGTASFASLLTSGGVRKIDFTVGTSGSDLNMNSVAISSGAQVSISSLTVTAGN
jgi:hypothetical protein